MRVVGSTHKLAPGATQGRTVAFSIADGTVKATLATGEPMELRVAGSARKLAPGATLEVPL